MRRYLASLLFIAFAARAVASDVEFVRVWPQWQNADAFEHIGEYFGRAENDRGEIVLRTKPNERAGLYFLVRVKPTTAISSATFVVDVIRPDSPDPKSFRFPVSVAAKQQVFRLGLTSNDWPGGREAHPVAWKLTLIDASNHVLASEQSFLWAIPETQSSR
jgi:hypothetical protein